MKKPTRGGPRPNSGPKPTVKDGKRYTVYLSASDVQEVKDKGHKLGAFIRDAIREKLDREEITKTAAGAAQNEEA